jgi:cyclic-di-AMP phosphodiesterase PgpH
MPRFIILLEILEVFGSGAKIRQNFINPPPITGINVSFFHLKPIWRLFVKFVTNKPKAMSTLINWLQRNFSYLYKAVLFLLSVFLIVQLFPRQAGFEYEYEQARPWMYSDLIAPFDFAVLKTETELEAERQAVLQDFQPFFERRPQVVEMQRQAFEAAFLQAWAENANGQGFPDARRTIIKERSLQVLDTLYARGIIFLDDLFREQPASYEIRVVDGNVATEYRLGDFYTPAVAFMEAREQLEALGSAYVSLLEPILGRVLVPNIVYDEEMTRRAREMALEGIALTRGMVQQGEKIVSKGELITAEKFQILESFKAEYTRQMGHTVMKNLQYAGQFILVSISMIVLVLFLYVFRKDVFENNRKLLLILMTVLLMIFLTSLVVRYNVEWLYLLPVVIVPVVIRAFFDNRLALYVHIITIILVGFLIPRSFEFVFLQFIAGIIAIMSMAGLRRRSQLFFTAVLVFFTYSAVFFGLSLAHTGSFDNVQWVNFGYFAGAAALTLFAYPLIFMFEKLFGLPTDFSLLELADTNNDLLRELSLKAPGTFQHSLQVANLAEEAIFAIGGNTLLTRTGALYHDIGKMDDPFYFIENQTTGVNPHDDIPHEESARIIINHVIAGIEKARKKNIPEYVIDFIRTHHGTTTARYFFTMQQKENPDEDIDVKSFTYPGPRPFSKETAVVMMADSVEAASRSMKKPNEQNISELVDNIIDIQIAEKQFDNANITFKDITTIKKIFRRRLMNIYHVRLAYPSMN